MAKRRTACWCLRFEQARQKPSSWRDLVFGFDNGAQTWPPDAQVETSNAFEIHSLDIAPRKAVRQGRAASWSSGESMGWGTGQEIANISSVLHVRHFVATGVWCEHRESNLLRKILSETFLSCRFPHHNAIKLDCAMQINRLIWDTSRKLGRIDEPTSLPGFRRKLNSAVPWEPNISTGSTSN